MTHETDEGNEGAQRPAATTESRRAVLKTAGTAAAVGTVGLTASSGTASATPFGDEIPRLGLTGEEVTTSGEIPSGESEVLFFVHGWFGNLATDVQAKPLRNSLRDNGYDHPVVAVEWDATEPDFPTAEDDADTAAERLATWLGEYTDDNAETTVRVVGHSLGGRVVMTLLESLDDTVLDTVAMVGAAVDSDAVCGDSRYADPIANATAAVNNYHSTSDAVICDGFGDSASGLGCTGAACEETPDGYTDVDVSDEVGTHVTYYAFGDGCVGQLVEDFDGFEGDDGSDDGGLFDGLF